MTAIDAVTASDSNIHVADSADATPVSRGIILHDSDSSSDTSTTMSFGDFLDMINPLQHIPVISSIYRAVTGDTINPVPRIAGDALYGGAMGLASAGIGALIAIGDEVLAANNDGKTAVGTLVAAITGDNGNDDNAAKKTAQVATATTTATATAATPVTMPTTTSAPMAIATAASATTAPISVVPTAAPAATIPTATAMITPATPSDVLAHTVASAYAAAQKRANSTTRGANLEQAAAAANATSDPDLGLALNTSKLPYGGVMDTRLLHNAMQNQAMALALANRRNTMEAAHSIRDSRFATAGAPHSAPTVNSAIPAAASLPMPAPTPVANDTATGDANTTPTTSAVTQEAAAQGLPLPLRNDARALKGLNMYREHAAVAMPLVNVPSGPLNGFAN